MRGQLSHSMNFITAIIPTLNLINSVESSHKK